MIIKSLSRAALAAVILTGTALSSGAATWTAISTADAFLATGSPFNPVGADLTAVNFGGAGTLAVSPADSTKGAFESLLKFTLWGTGGAAAHFAAQYGAGNWHITGVSLTLASNFAVSGTQPNNAIFNTISGGAFGISWISDDSWIEGSGTPSSNTPAADGSVTYNSLSTLLSSSDEEVGTYNYAPPGNNVPLTWNLDLTSGFLADTMSSDQLSFLFYATPGSSVGYLFNSKSFASNRPFITITAVPEPGTISLLLGGIAALGLTLRRLRRK